MLLKIDNFSDSKLYLLSVLQSFYILYIFEYMYIAIYLRICIVEENYEKEYFARR